MIKTHCNSNQLSRRQFSLRAGASALITAGALPLTLPGSTRQELPAPRPDPDALLRHLRLKTAATLDEMKRFYGDALGFPFEQEQDDQITFVAGTTQLTFERTERKNKGNPFYQVAFNIPENKHDASVQWLIRQEINIHRVRHFQHWNAHAVFFLDPANNLLEFIARHDLPNAASGSFAPVRDALCASEIAFIVDNDREFGKLICEATGLPRFRGAVFPGTDHGILLVFNKGRLWHRPAATFPITVDIAVKRNAAFESADYPFAIHMG